MRQLLERVTCDRCGRVFTFEKFCEVGHMYRVETLTEWLLMLGWKMTDGLHRMDVCPTCVATRPKLKMEEKQ